MNPMNDSIVEKMRQEIIRRSDLFEEQTKGTKDEYNLYREHVQYVYKYAVMLSKDADVDKEVMRIISESYEKYAKGDAICTPNK